MAFVIGMSKSDDARMSSDGCASSGTLSNRYRVAWHQQNSKIVSGFCQFCWFFWFPETWKGNFLEKSQHFVRYRSGLGSAGLNDARPCRQVSTKRDIGKGVSASECQTGGWVGRWAAG